MEPKMSWKVLLCLLGAVRCAVIWNGNFDSYNSATDFDIWQWGNQVGQYQTYIFGNGYSGAKMSNYIAVSASYRNPADDSSQKGIQLKIDSTSVWNGQTMLRTELIPNKPNTDYQNGKIYYKWSMKQTASNPLRTQNEHQLVFFEAHFGDIKYGGSGGDNLYFVVNSQNVWSTPFTKDTWFNFALEVDYTASTVALYHSQNGGSLVKVYPATRASVSRSDFHLGNLRLPVGGVQDPNAEWLYYSGVQVVDTLPSTTQANNPTSQANNPTSQGNNPTSQGNNPTSQGNNPTSQGNNNPTSAGSNCDPTFCTNACGSAPVASCVCTATGMEFTCNSGYTLVPAIMLLLFLFYFAF